VRLVAAAAVSQSDTTANATVIWRGIADIVAVSTATAEAQRVLHAVAGVLCQSGMSAAGRYLWEPEGIQSETWQTQENVIENWSTQSVSSESWDSSVIPSATWVPQTISGETWTVN
jgi:hypothetical protein